MRRTSFNSLEHFAAWPAGALSFLAKSLQLMFGQAKRFLGHECPIAAVCGYPSAGTLFVTASADAIRIWDVLEDHGTTDSQVSRTAHLICT